MQYITRYMNRNPRRQKYLKISRNWRRAALMGTMFAYLHMGKQAVERCADALLKILCLCLSLISIQSFTMEGGSVSIFK